MKRRLLIRHFNNMGNYGSAMMGVNTVHRLREIAGPDLEMTCRCDTPTDRGLLLTELGKGDWNLNTLPRETDETRRRPSWPKRLLRFALLEPIRLRRDRARQFCQGYDAMIILGGDDLSEYYKSPGQMRRYLADLFFQTRELPLVLLGQTVGPFSSWGKHLAAMVLRRCHVFSRDVWTQNYLHSDLRVRNATLAADLAWLDLPRQNEEGLFEETAGRWGIVSDRYISVIVSALWWHYCSDRTTYLDFWRGLVLRLVRHAGLEGRRVCLVPHTVAEPHGDERVLIREIVEQLPADARESVVVIDDVLGPTRTRLLLGHGLLTITGRMHAAVSTFQMGRSALSLAYSVKFGGVIGGSLGRPDLILPCAKNQIPESDWCDNSLAKRILGKVDYILTNRDRLEREIHDAVLRQKELASASLCRVVEIINST